MVLNNLLSLLNYHNLIGGFIIKSIYKSILIACLVMICSIGTVSATDLNDNSTVEVISSVDDCISVDEVTLLMLNKVRRWLVQMPLLGMS